MGEHLIKFNNRQELRDCFGYFGIRDIKRNVFIDDFICFNEVKELVQGPDACFFDMDGWLVIICDKLQQVCVRYLPEGVDLFLIDKIVKF